MDVVPLQWWRARETWTWAVGGQTVDGLDAEEWLRLGVEAASLRWERLRRRWSTKHTQEG